MRRRTLRSFVAILALLGVLFAQLGMAAHACPMPAGGDDCCVSMDPPEPALCDAHCEQGGQSLDKPVATIALPVLAVVRTIVPQVAAPPPRQSAPPQARPVSILHCRFRI